jgi:hypothetical protein
MMMNEAKGWLDMLGSMNCIHWSQEYCLATWPEQYTSHHRDPTIVLEVVAYKNFWILH